MVRCYRLKVYSFLLFVLKGLDISWDSHLGLSDLVLKLDCFVYSPELLLSQRQNLSTESWLIFSGCDESSLVFLISFSFPSMFYSYTDWYFFPFYLQSLISFKLLACCSQMAWEQFYVMSLTQGLGEIAAEGITKDYPGACALSTGPVSCVFHLLPHLFCTLCCCGKSHHRAVFVFLACSWDEKCRSCIMSQPSSASLRSTNQVLSC